MIEITLKDYLQERLDLPVYLEIPPDHPEMYVVIEKTGTGLTNRVKRATFAIQSIAPSMYEAAELNERVKDAMDDAIILDDIARSHLNSDYNYTDQATHEYRYQAVYDLVHY